MDENIIKSLEQVVLKDIKKYEKEKDLQTRERLLKCTMANIKILNVKEKELFDSKKLDFDIQKFNSEQSMLEKKMKLEEERHKIENIKNETKDKKDNIMKYLELTLKGLSISLPLIVSLLMWYGQNRLIYIDDGRATPELKEIIKSVNKKVF